MTEAEWLAGTEPNEMLSYLFKEPSYRLLRAWWARGPMQVRRSSPRKVRLFLCGAVGHVAGWLPDPAGRAALATAERFADGRAGMEELVAAMLAIPEPGPEAAPAGHAESDEVGAWKEAQTVLMTRMAIRIAASPDPNLAWARAACAASRSLTHDTAGCCQPFQARLARCIFGNPFRPVAFTPGWRTTSAVALADAMYQSRDFGPMPVLADALEDAGCDHPDALGHCRGDGPHARGCWVVDSVLGKG